MLFVEKLQNTLNLDAEGIFLSCHSYQRGADLSSYVFAAGSFHRLVEWQIDERLSLIMNWHTHKISRDELATARAKVMSAI